MLAGEVDLIAQENLAQGRLEVDMTAFWPAFPDVDNRLMMSFQLVSRGLTSAVMFLADGETVQPAEVSLQKGHPGGTRQLSSGHRRD